MKHLKDWIDRISEPHDSVFSNSFLRSIAAGRNKTYYWIWLIQIVLNFLPLLSGTTEHFDIINLIMLGIQFTVARLFLQRKPKVFNYTYGFIFFGFLVLRSQLRPKKIIETWHISFTFPIYQYTATGDKKSMLLGAILAQIYTHCFLESPLLQHFGDTSFQAIIKEMIIITSSNTIVLVILLMILNGTMDQAYMQYDQAKKQEFDQQKTFFLSFSHELRNLINSMTGNINIALADTLSVTTRESLEAAKIATELLLHLVNNILDRGKVEINDLEITPSFVNLYNSLERSWAICSELIRRKGLKGMLTISKDVPLCVKMDDHRITQILLNLVSNAAKFTERGSIKIVVNWIPGLEAVEESCFSPRPYDEENEGVFEKEISLHGIKVFDKPHLNSIILDENHKKIRHNKRPTTGVVTPKGVLKFTVADTGIGINPQDQERLFQKFSQLHSSEKKLGTGLGLYITRELCRKMKGDIRVFSKPNYGSTFMICIPTEIETPSEIKLQSIEAAEAQKLIASKNLKALLVDDSEFNIRVLKNYLLKLGVTNITCAYNGREAYRLYREAFEIGRPFDFITMDVDMPIMDGKQATRLIRTFESQVRLRGSLIIMVSGNCLESEINACIDMEGDIKANHFLKKPVTSDQLLSPLVERFCVS